MSRRISTSTPQLPRWLLDPGRREKLQQVIDQHQLSLHGTRAAVETYLLGMMSAHDGRRLRWLLQYLQVVHGHLVLRAPARPGSRQLQAREWIDAAMADEARAAELADAELARHAAAEDAEP